MEKHITPAIICACIVAVFAMMTSCEKHAHEHGFTVPSFLAD